MSLVYENKVSPFIRTAFVEKVKQVSSRLGINPNWLMAVMYFETAFTFRANIWNPDRTAVGLIQFTKVAADSLGVTLEYLAGLNEIQQLEYVYRYYRLWKQYKPKSYTDLYMLTFFPAAFNQPGSFILRSNHLSAGTVARANPAFDLDKSGFITKREAELAMLAKHSKEALKLILQKAGSGSALFAGAAALAVGVSLAVIFSPPKNRKLLKRRK